MTARATEALARAWNRLDPGLLAPWLREDVRYDSPETELSLQGRTQVMSHLARKVELIEKVGDTARVRAQLGHVATAGDPFRPCVISGQGELERAALFLVTVDSNGLIESVRVVTSDPDPSLAVGSGEFPS
jgi:hypothetical protein